MSMFMDILEGSEGPRAGDYLIAKGKRGHDASYWVISSRRVKRRDPSAVPRYHMEVKRISAIPFKRCRVFEFTWYPRKKRRQSFEQYMHRKSGTA